MTECPPGLLQNLLLNFKKIHDILNVVTGTSTLLHQSRSGGAMNRKRINGKTMNPTDRFRPYRCMCLTACLALAMTGTALAEEDR